MLTSITNKVTTRINLNIILLNMNLNDWCLSISSAMTFLNHLKMNKIKWTEDLSRTAKTRLPYNQSFYWLISFTKFIASPNMPTTYKPKHISYSRFRCRLSLNESFSIVSNQFYVCFHTKSLQNLHLCRYSNAGHSFCMIFTRCIRKELNRYRD